MKEQNFVSVSYSSFLLVTARAKTTYKNLSEDRQAN